MKKCGFLLTALTVLAVTIPVCAAEADLNYMTGAVVISGNTSVASECVTVNILKPGITAKSLYEEDGNGIFYNNDTTTDKQGAYHFNLNFEDGAVEGEYTVYVGAKSYNRAEVVKLPYLTKDTYIAAAEKLNQTAAVSEEAFKTELGKLKNSMGFVNKYEENLNSDKVAEIFCRSLREQHLSVSDSGINKKLYNSAVAAQALNEKKISNMDDIIDKIVLDNTATAEFYHSIIRAGKNGIGFYISLLEGKGIESAQALEKELVNATVLTTVRYHNGIGNIEKVFKEYREEIGANTASAKNSDYSYIAGKTYNSVSECVTDFNAHVSQSSSSGGGTGGTGGGGSSSGRTESTAQAARGAAPDENAGKLTPIGIKFEDLNSVQWAYEAISKLFVKGVIAGRSDIMFAPDDSVTREEFVKLIVTALDFTAENFEIKYNDVSAEDWYYEYVGIASANGICQGIGDGRFGTGTDITRQDMCVMLANAMKAKGYHLLDGTLGFSDKDAVDDYAYQAVSALAAMKVVNGVGDNKFDPQGTATRAQAAVIVNNVLEQ